MKGERAHPSYSLFILSKYVCATMNDHHKSIVSLLIFNVTKLDNFMNENKSVEWNNSSEIQEYLLLSSSSN